MVWSPLACGFLSGKYTHENPTGNGDRLTGFDIIPLDREHGYDLVEKLREIGWQHDASPAQVALTWLLSRPAVTSILVGASNVSLLQENLDANALKLSADELIALDRLTEPRAIYPNWFNQSVYDVQVREAIAQKNA